MVGWAIWHKGLEKQVYFQRCLGFTPVAVRKYPDTKQRGRRNLYFSSQFEVIGYPYRGVAEAADCTTSIVKSREKQMHSCSLLAFCLVGSRLSCIVQVLPREWSEQWVEFPHTSYSHQVNLPPKRATSQPDIDSSSADTFLLGDSRLYEVDSNNQLTHTLPSSDSRGEHSAPDGTVVSNRELEHANWVACSR